MSRLARKIENLTKRSCDAPGGAGQPVTEDGEE